jgi:hypothetical protein
VFAFAAAIKSYLAPVVALQVAQQVLYDSGFEIFDPVQPGKITMGGEHPSGVLVTVVAIDCEGGSANVVNAFSPHDAAGAQQMAGTVYQAIQAS